MDNTRHLFVINPVAGRGNAAKTLPPAIRTAAERRGVSAQIVQTEYPGHAAALAREILQNGASGPWRVYACGGDGTLREVVEGLAGEPQVEIGVIPCGTGNDFVSTFGAGALFGDVAAMMAGEAVPVDLMAVETESPEGERREYRAVNICSAGLDARVAGDMRKFHAFLRLGAQLPYNLSVVYNLLRGIHQPYLVSIDGRPFDDRYTLVTACNGQYYGGGFHPMPRARPDDGLLDFLLIRRVSRLRAASLVKTFASGEFEKLGELALYLRGTSMDILCERPEPVNMDGEIILTRRVRFSLARERVRLILPASLQKQAEGAPPFA